ncbi:MAG: spore gernimation protein [Ruminiclostridium sp.]|nr:spore gernimation protein [Ruminiclostridium sp.]
MIKEGKFGVTEAVSMVTITISSKALFTTPATFASSVGTAGWYMTFISAAVGIAGFTFVYFLLKRFPGKDIVEIFEITLGRFAGSVFSVLIAYTLLYYATTSLREFMDIYKEYILPLSPPEYLIALFLMGVSILCFYGLESIARFCRLFAYILLFGFAFGIIISAKNFDIYRLFPIWGYGIGKTLFEGIHRSSSYGEVIILAVIAGSLQGIKNIKKAGYRSLVFTAVLLSISLLASSLTFHYNIKQELASTLYSMTQLIDYGRFFQRLDPIFLFLWNITYLVSITVILYIVISIFCKMSRIQDTRPVILPFIFILFAGAMLPRDMTQAIGMVEIYREYGWSAYFVLPLIALIAAGLRKKRGVPDE